MRDYYEILGVSRDASDDELKKAYRKLSMQLHPDRQVGKSDAEKKDAEEKFKEVSVAYACLSDKDKRARYDQFGSEDGPQGFGGFGGEEFDPFDLFKQMHGGMGGMFGGGGRFRHRDPADEINMPEDGDDIQTRINITFKESIFGCTKEFDLNLDKECPDCHGRGIENGTTPTKCPHCHGLGQIISEVRQGCFISRTSRPCPYCHGKGITAQQCKKCGGEKRVHDIKHIKVKIPAGIQDGQRLRLRNSGHCGIKGGENGSMFISICVQQSDLFMRDENDIKIKMYIPATLATFGGKIDVPTVYGYKKMKIAAGIMSGTLMRVPGAGVKPESGSPGDMYIEILIEPYANVTSEQKKLLEKLQKSEVASNFKHAQETLRKADAFYK